MWEIRNIPDPEKGGNKKDMKNKVQLVCSGLGAVAFNPTDFRNNIRYHCKEESTIRNS